MGKGEQFMTKGGKMGELMRSKDWSKTSLGSAEVWPQSLKAAVGIMLNANFPMFIWWGPDLICFYNDAYIPKLQENDKHPSTFGQPAKETWPEIWHNIKPIVDRVINGEEAIGIENQLTPIYRNANITPLYENDGAVSGIVVTVNDVTDEVETRIKVDEAEERLRLAAEATELSTWDLDLQTRSIIYSSRLIEIFGHPPGHVLTHQSMRDQIHPEDIHSIVEKAFDVALQTGQYKYEARVVKPNAEICWISTQGKVFFDGKGKPLKMIGTLRDITEAKEHQQELEESEQKFRLLADFMPQLIWTADPFGKLNYFNRAVFDYTGRNAQDLLAGEWLQIIHPDDRDENKISWKNALSNGTEFALEHRFLNHDGQYRWQLTRSIPQKDVAGNIQMWVGTSTDIHDQKTFLNELEHQVRERTNELEQKNRDLNKMNAELQSFAYVSSHDLQEPLRKIQTFASRILEKERANLTDTGKDYFGRIQQAANRMQTLIQDLLMYSRTNTTDRIFKETDLNEIVDEVRNEFKEGLLEKDATIEVEKLCAIRTIPFQFRQLMDNLVGNALKFSMPGRPLLLKIKSEIVPADEINVGFAQEEKQYCHISVSDNGIGFDPRYKDRIFEVFQRLHAKDEYSGTGIGLAIVKKIVENHNGVITATGEIDKGATFDIYIPV